MPCNKKTKKLLFTETSSPFLFSPVLLLCSFDNLLQRFCDHCFQLRLICRCLDGQLTDQCCYVIVSNLTKGKGLQKDGHVGIDEEARDVSSISGLRPPFSFAVEVNV